MCAGSIRGNVGSEDVDRTDVKHSFHPHVRGNGSFSHLRPLPPQCPPYSNPADYWVDVISVPPAGSGGSGARRATAVRARVAALADACAARRGPLLGALRADGDAALARAALPAAGAAGAGAESVAAAEEGRAAAPGPAPAGGGGGARRWLTEFAALAARAGRLALRSRLENAVTLGRTALFSLLLGLIWRAPCAIHAHRHTSARPSLTLSPRPPAPRLGTGPDGSPQGVRNTGGLLFFSLLQMSFTTVFAVIFVFVGELATVGRERTAGTYCCSSYFLARLAVQMPRALLGAVLHCAPLYWMVALRPTASAFALFVAINLLVGLNCEAVTMVITSGASDMRVAAALAPLPVVIGILFGGFFVQPGAIPVWLRWIRYVTFVRWGFVAVVRNQFPTGPAADLLVPNAVLDVAQCCAVLLGMLAACYAGAFAVLRRNLPDYDASV